MERYYQRKDTTPIFTNPKLPTELIAQGVQRQQQTINDLKAQELEKLEGQYWKNIYGTDILTQDARDRAQMNKDLEGIENEYTSLISNLSNENINEAKKTLSKYKNAYETYSALEEIQENRYKLRQKQHDSLNREEDAEVSKRASDLLIDKRVMGDREYNYEARTDKEKSDASGYVFSKVKQLENWDTTVGGTYGLNTSWYTDYTNKDSTKTLSRIDSAIADIINTDEVKREWQERVYFKTQNIRNMAELELRTGEMTEEEYSREMKRIEEIEKKENEAFNHFYNQRPSTGNGVREKINKAREEYQETEIYEIVTPAYNLEDRDTSRIHRKKKNDDFGPTGKRKGIDAVEVFRGNTVTEKYSAKELIEANKNTTESINSIRRNKEISQLASLAAPLIKQGITSPDAFRQAYQEAYPDREVPSFTKINSALNLIKGGGSLSDLTDEDLDIIERKETYNQGKYASQEKDLLEVKKDNSNILISNMSDAKFKRYKEDLAETWMGASKEAREQYLQTIEDYNIQDITKDDIMRMSREDVGIFDVLRVGDSAEMPFVAAFEFAKPIYDYFDDVEDETYTYDTQINAVEIGNSESTILDDSYKNSTFDSKEVYAASEGARREDGRIVTSKNTKVGFAYGNSDIMLKLNWTDEETEKDEQAYIVNTLSPEEMKERENELFMSNDPGEMDIGWNFFGHRHMGQQYKKMAHTPTFQQNGGKGTLDLTHLNNNTEYKINYTKFSDGSYEASIDTEEGSQKHFFDSDAELITTVNEKIIPTLSAGQQKLNQYK